MPKIAYIEKTFRRTTQVVIDQANAIIAEYAAQGFILTLRQLFYQFVARALLANRQAEYKRLGEIVGDARLAGRIDWDHLEDRTRWLRRNGHWSDPTSILRSAADSYAIDKWEQQPYRPIVLIEKDALVGVIQGVCQTNDVAYFACRGYTSLSEVWSLAYHELNAYIATGQVPVLFHLGDHDPSGLDMTRDLRDRMELFCGQEIPVQRLALNMDQVAQYNPPPNPAKTDDSRYAGYALEFGDESWELDALDPTVLAGLVGDAIGSVRDAGLWAEALAAESSAKTRLARIASDLPVVEAFLEAKDR
jgi:hypothetical protein